MCDVGIQCDLLCPPLTLSPKKGRVGPVVVDTDPFELTHTLGAKDIVYKVLQCS